MFPKPEGVEQYYSETLFLELAPVKHNNSRSVSFSFPPDVVPGSRRAHVALVGTSTICPPCCASGVSIWLLFMFAFSQLGMCNMLAFFLFSLDDELRYMRIKLKAVLKTLRYWMLNGNDGHQTGMFMAGRFWTAVRLFGLAPFRLRDVGNLSW